MKKQTDECNFGGKVWNSVIRTTITVDEEDWFVSNILLGVNTCDNSIMCVRAEDGSFAASFSPINTLLL